MYKANLLKYAETAWQSGLSTPSNWLKIQVFTVLKVFFTSQTVFFPKADQKALEKLGPGKLPSHWASAAHSMLPASRWAPGPIGGADVSPEFWRITTAIRW